MPGCSLVLWLQAGETHIFFLNVFLSKLNRLDLNGVAQTDNFNKRGDSYFLLNDHTDNKVY